MSAGIWFWLIYVICLVFGAYFNWPHDGRYHALGSSLVLFVLLGLLGWQTFGPPIKGGGDGK